MNRSNTTGNITNDNTQRKLGDFIRELLAHVSITFDGSSGAFHIDITPVNNAVEPTNTPTVIEATDDVKRIEQKKQAGGDRSKGNNKNKTSSVNCKSSTPSKRKS